MKVVQINSVSNGSTGKIMNDIHRCLLNEKIDSIIIWGRGRNGNNKNEFYIKDKLGFYLHVVLTRITGKTGFFSKNATKRIINILENYKPDIVHLHNIHGYYINVEMLFNYLKKKKIKIVWTLHDCWPFTGQCSYFTYKNCNKWLSGCHKCPMISEYPKTLIDKSKWNYRKKKELFCGLDITIVTPSVWLSNLVKKSFLSKNPVVVINNGIDTTIFKKRISDFKKKYNIENKKIILGVAGIWDKRKGLDDFISLANVINDNYRIVIIGISKEQLKKLPKNIIGITRTENQIELAEIYSCADVLFNPTYEDNYPTVNLEAIACGCPVLTYDTGGSFESAKFFGMKVSKEEMLSNYENILSTNFYNSKPDLSREKMCDNYIDLYKKIVKR